MRILSVFLVVFSLLSCKKDESTNTTLQGLRGSKKVVHRDSIDLFARATTDGDFHFWFRNYWPEGKSFLYSKEIKSQAFQFSGGYLQRPWQNIDEGDDRFDRFVGSFQFDDTNTPAHLVKAVVILNDTIFESRAMRVERLSTEDEDLLDIDLENPVKPEFSWKGAPTPAGGYLHQLNDREGKMLTSMTWPTDEFDFYTVFDASKIYLDDFAQPELIAGQRYRFEVFGLDSNKFALWHDTRSFFAIENGLIDE